jgi:fumarate hydratase class II
MSEMLLQTCAHVIGGEATIAFAGATLGTFDLHVGMPVMAHAFLESTRLLTAAVRTFTDRCVEGIEADVERCKSLIEGSLAMCTSLAPVIGYDTAAAIAKKAYATGRTVREVALDEKALPEDELNRLLDAMSMTKPQA